MAYAMMTDGLWQEIGPQGFRLSTADGTDYIQCPPEWVETMSADDRTAADICEIAEPGPAPTDARVIGMELVDVGGRPERIWKVEPYTLDEVKAQQRAAALAERDRRIGDGADFMDAYMAWQAISVAIKAAKTVEAVRAIDVTTGYPAE
ncbi:hypothetical protein [uncultured Sphingomonas sp.]|uniref:hypothetical protein n=1 Tax=uncultured Sphingomonas sp. TaxID=158754 RepID=UPI0025F6FE2B|nr:hypothetical protein [uncultured Sphingomonas sp.]